MVEGGLTVLDTIFMKDATTITLETSGAIMCMTAAIIAGLLIGLVYIIITKGKDRSSNFALSLVILPIAVAVVIMLVGGNVARAFSMAGVFTLVRFRSVPGDSKDLIFVFYCMTVGLALGLGYIVFGGIITIIIGLLLVVLTKIGFGATILRDKKLRITIPEDMNYQSAFEDLLDKYTRWHNIEKVKTTNLGTLYELTYNVMMKENVSEKEFIDELRCRNGNLNIQLEAYEARNQQL